LGRSCFCSLFNLAQGFFAYFVLFLSVVNYPVRPWANGNSRNLSQRRQESGEEGIRSRRSPVSEYAVGR